MSALWPPLSLANRRAAPSASRWASRWSCRDGLSTHRRQWYRCSSFPRLCLSFGALPRVSVQAKGKDEGDQTLARPVKRSAYSIRPSPLRQGSHLPSAVPSRLLGAKSHKTSIRSLYSLPIAALLLRHIRVIEYFNNGRVFWCFHDLRCFYFNDFDERKPKYPTNLIIRNV